jgi:hypothetical protein
VRKKCGSSGKRVLASTTFRLLSCIGFTNEETAWNILITCRIERQYSPPSRSSGRGWGRVSNCWRKAPLYDPPLAPPLPGWGTYSTIDSACCLKSGTDNWRPESTLFPDEPKILLLWSFLRTVHCALCTPVSLLPSPVSRLLSHTTSTQNVSL